MDFTLRDWQEQDIAAIARYGNNPKIAANLRNAFPYPYRTKDAEDYIKSCMANDCSKNILKAITVEGTAVGSIGLFTGSDVYCKCAELGYWLAEDFWGKGIMSMAVSQICRQGFLQLDIIRIFAEPFAYNIGSRKVLEKAGFTLEGILKNSIYKNGVVHDSCMYALFK